MVDVYISYLLLSSKIGNLLFVACDFLGTEWMCKGYLSWDAVGMDRSGLVHVGTYDSH
jgi:hypothetical protein